MTGEEVSLKEHLETIINEHDRNYRELFRLSEVAVKTALIEQEKSVAKAFESSEKAISKQEEAQRVFNEAYRQEVLGLFKALDDKIETLRKDIGNLQGTRSEQTGSKTSIQAGWLYLTTAIGGISTIVLLILRVAGK